MGFPFEHLRDVQAAINRKQDAHTVDYSNPSVTAELFPCWYNKPAQKQLIEEVFERGVSHCEERGEHLTDSDLAALGDAILRQISRAYKDPAFEDEREWRLVININRPPRGVSYGFGAPSEPEGEKPRDNTKDQVTVEFRGGEFTLIPYVAVPLTANGSFCIAEVVVGPTPLQELARRAAMRYLQSNVRGVKISRSECPFRRV